MSDYLRKFRDEFNALVGLPVVGGSVSWAKRALFYLALGLCLWLGERGAAERPGVFRAEPSSTTALLIAIGLSAASTGASLLINRVLGPKPEQRVVGKFSGSTQVSDSQFGVEKYEIYGGRPDPTGDGDDRLGGVTVGVNFFWMNRDEIREHRTTVQGSSGGRGKGPPSAPPDVRVSYDCDIAGLVGKGPLDVFQVRFNQDLVVDISQAGGATANRSYEAEDAELSPAASVVSESDVSGGARVSILPGDWVRFENVRGVASDGGTHEIAIVWRSNATTNVELDVNGATETLTFDYNGSFALHTYTVEVTLDEGATNTIQITNTGAGATSIDRIIITTPADVDDGDGVTGLEDPYAPRDEGYDHFFLPDPKIRDSRTRLRVTAGPTIDGDGVTTLPVSGDACASITVYPGTSDQPVDADISADIESRAGYGPGYTPAFLDDCYVKIMGLNVSKYRGIPNVRVTAEHQTLKTLEAILLHRALRAAGALAAAADFDFSEAEGVPSRGFLVSRRQAPKTDMQDLGQWHNFAFYEDVDGKVKARDLSRRETDFELTANDLGAHVVGGDSDQSQIVDVATKANAATDGWRSLDVGFFDAKGDLKGNTRQAQREVTESERHETIEFPVTATPDEALAVAKRLLQKHECELDPHTVSVDSSFLWLVPTMRGTVPVDGTTQTLRIEETQGAYPGVLRLSLVNDGLSVIAGASAEDAARSRVRFPAQTLASFIDIVALHPQAVPGVYVAATPRPTRGNSYWNGATAYRKVESEWQRMTTFDAPATMGACVTALGDVPGGWVEGDWDDTNTVTIDLAYGTAPTFTDDEVTSGLGIWVIGGEVCGVGTWTRDNDYPNRWVGSHLRRRLKGTSATGHLAGERVVLMNSAVRFVELSISEKGEARTWSVVSDGASLATSAELEFTWEGASVPSFAVAGPNAHVPSIGAAPSIRKDDAGANWIVYCERPSAYGIPVTALELRLYSDAGATALVRTLPGDMSGRVRVAQTSANGYFKYRWRNDSLEDAGDGEGWSALSGTSGVAYGTASGTQNALDSGLATFDSDPDDSGNPTKRNYTYPSTPA